MRVFVAHSFRDRDLVHAVVAHLRDDGHTVFRPEETAAPADLLSEISAGLRSADVVVAIVTASNPNVFYELGVAAGANVPTLIAARPGESLPANLASVPYVQLTGDVFRDANEIGRRMKDLEGLSSPKVVEFSSAEGALLAASRDPAVLEALAPSDFERLIARLLRERGFELEQSPSDRDAGVDIVARAPGDGQILLVEVKKLSKQGRVSVDAVRRLLAAVSLAPDAIGVLVSTSGFTAAAAALAAGSPIVLRTLEEILAARSKGDLLLSTHGG
jgi:hypothetical protein